ncbi:acetate/propionate family kinase [Roseateles koreensis]|uniref:Acetate kinase n=1 Tax=Roseateles koreensis TaxID=2987526 RepID=A0ABT5KMY3_9BURK|nr:acetate/propionate family kinase [Roseateles koreensis]MDC8784197.1 acetate/propionate family kinase [Roseateles koreensis]
MNAHNTPPSRDEILAVNAGSSSLKFGLYHCAKAGSEQHAHLSGCFDGLEPGGKPRLRLSDRADEALQVGPGQNAFEQALRRLQALLRDSAPSLRAVAHRVVHGGGVFEGPVRVDATVMAQLRRFEKLAPLHQPHNLDGVQAFAQVWPELPQIACFDTAFHAQLPALEQRFALPEIPALEGVRRYGFHGLSYDYLNQRLHERSTRAQLPGTRALLAHLGNGASLCATLSGQSVATSMGFSALDGLMMGTRSGSVDPGLLLHLLQQGWSAEQIETLLYRQSGLRGVSGISADMRTLRASDASQAQEAIRLFAYRLRREAGALIAVLGGLDILAFTGGIGEHDAALRADLCAGLSFMGVSLDTAANARAVGDTLYAIHAPGSQVEVWVVPTDEGSVAAAQAAALLRNGG